MRIRWTLASAIVIAGIGFLGAGAALHPVAAQETATSTLTVTVEASCTVTGLDVTGVNYYGAEVDQPGHFVQLNCTGVYDDITQVICVDAGQTPDQGVRRLADGTGNFLEYYLYNPLFASQTQELGNTGGDAVSGLTCSGGTYNAPPLIYTLAVNGGNGNVGSLWNYDLVIPAGLSVPPGSYSDTVNIEFWWSVQ